MLIVCPSCTRSYTVDPASLQPDGRQVRCMSCRTVWRADPNQSQEQPSLDALLPAVAPARTAAAAAAWQDIEEAQPPVGAASQGEWLEALAEGAPAGRSLAVPAAAAVAERDPATAGSIEAHNEASEAVATDAPPLAASVADAEPPTIDVEVNRGADADRARADDIEKAAGRQSRRPAKRRRPLLWPLSRLQIAVIALLIVDAILVAWRKDIVRLLPQTAPFYAAIGLPVNLLGVTFDDLKTSADENAGVPILVVQGNIVNATDAIANLPRLKLIIRNAAKQEIYSWTTAPPRGQLPPFEAIGFRTRLASPPPGAHDVLVRFVAADERFATAP
jgi:predicted Zn finger-like uncharacterized protein